MKYAGIVLFVIGLGLMGLSYYINERVKSETSAAYEASNKLSDNPLVELGGPITEGATHEVGTSVDNQVEKKAMPYEIMADYAHTLGLILIVLGAVIALFYTVRRFH